MGRYLTWPLIRFASLKMSCLWTQWSDNPVNLDEFAFHGQ